VKRELFLLFTFSFVFFILGNWVLSLTSLDEGRNFYATLHMLKTGDFLVPYYNCAPRFEKPPLLYWLGSLSLSVFSHPEFSVRLVSGAFATLTALAVYLLARTHVGKEKALTSALVFVLLPHTWVEARAYVPEFVLVFFSTLGLYLWSIGRYRLGWLSLGFAFLAKGPVGVFLPTIVYLIWRRDLRFIDPSGILIFVLVGFSWYFLMLYKFGFEYFFKFFVYENVYRFTGKYKIHGLPFYFYPLLVFLNSLFFLPALLRAFVRPEKKLLFFYIWLLSVVFFYSLSENKLHHYILFSYPALAVILGNYTGERYLKRVFPFAFSLLLILLFLAHAYEGKRFTPKAVKYLKRENPGELYFYKHENSAIVAYLYRCIQKRGEFRGGELVITKKKYLKELGEVEVLVEGLEFEGREVLVRITPSSRFLWRTLLPKLRKILTNYYIQFQIKVKIERGRKKSL